MSRLMTPQEVAEMLQVRPSTIYQWVHQEFIPHVKLGRLLRFRECDVMAWLEKRAKEGRTSRRVEV